jgi:DNA-binding NtrC family response regulator
VDLRLPDEEDGMGLLKELRAIAPDLPIVMITAFGTTKAAVEAMQVGATDFIDKSPEFTQILSMKVMQLLRNRQERAELMREVEEKYRFGRIVGKSPVVEKMLDAMSRVVDTDATVLIQGETGTGKELVARALHYQGPRKERRFVAVTCTAIPRELLESELFGYVKGAFTGATKDKPGTFELANEGTIFLDEIGDMGLELQAKILRVLDEKAVVRLGEGVVRRVNARVIAATNRNLQRSIASGSFREDLYHRLNVFSITVPPLRERRGDIALLAQHFVAKFSLDLNRDVTGIDEAALKLLERYDFPGNIRELANIVERAVLFEDSKTIRATNPALSFPRDSRTVADGTAFMDLPFSEAKDEFEKRYLEKLLERANGNKTRAAELSGIERSNLKDKLEKHKIDIPHNKG